MRKIIFLDFDGVMHPDGIGTFSQRSLFEECLSKMPDVGIVVSSSWRETESLDELRTHFSAKFRDQIIGTTPSLDSGYDVGGRQREIEAFLRSSQWTIANCAWIALDDTALFFDEDCPNLMLTDASQGFTRQTAHDLLAWYRGG